MLGKNLETSVRYLAVSSLEFNLRFSKMESNPKDLVSHKYAPYVSVSCLRMPEEGIGFPLTGVTDGCDPQCGAKN